MAYSIRTTHYLNATGAPINDRYEKQIFIKNKNWNPPPAPMLIEDKLTQFEKALKDKQSKLMSKYKRRNLSNLTSPQCQTLQVLKNNKHLVIKPTDKNLGPAIMDSASYVQQILKEHLLTKDYRRLSAIEAKLRMDQVKTYLKSLITGNQDNLSKAELLYFQRSLQSHHRIPIFYGLPKIHKSPVTLRPVVSGTNSLLAIFSNWLDYKMKELLPFVKSYIKNSFMVINDLKDLKIPKDALLFSADATSMYTNIDTKTGVTSIQNLIQTHKDKLPPNFPINLVLETLTIVMENNVFSFADTFWLQLAGRAMGTPTACAYDMLSYGHHENTKILEEFQPNLLYYKRYIDDIFGIWLPPKTNKINTWNCFKEKLNSWGSLEWIIQEPSTRTQFLDLNIHIQDSSILTETYQKPMNLYLYIPPFSAHPPSCFKGLITGELRRYWLQNNPTSFQNILIKFIQRLVDRGHTLENLIPILTQAAQTLETHSVGNNGSQKPNTLYIHWQHHPAGLQRRDIRRIYDKILKPHVPFDKMQIAISRPKNLRDVLTRAALQMPENYTVDNLMTTHEHG
jgi:hypothetical protein